jgi:hypothetical protein
VIQAALTRSQQMSPPRHVGTVIMTGVEAERELSFIANGPEAAPGLHFRAPAGPFVLLVLEAPFMTMATAKATLVTEPLMPERVDSSNRRERNQPGLRGGRPRRQLRHDPDERVDRGSDASFRPGA